MNVIALCVLFAFCFYRNFYDPNFNLQLAAQRRRVCSMIRFSAMSNNLPESQQPPQKMGAVTQAVDPSPVTSESNAEFPELRSPRVLLVDDSDVVRDVSRAVLEDAGVVVEEAADGAVAVNLLQAHPTRYALILMDVQMPVLDGLAATRLIHASLGERTPPIVALTANVSEEEKLRCLAAGMCDHVAKPVDPAQLVAVLNRWLASPSGGAQPALAAPPGSAVGRQLLPEVPGFDLHAGLQCVGGNAQRLSSMLGRFAASYATVTADLQQCVAQENYPEARRLAHTLKGAAATLGGVDIAHAAQAVEHAMQRRCEAAGDAMATVDLAELDAALQRALPALRSLHAASVQSEPAPVSDTASLRRLPQTEAAEFEALRQLLAGNCYAARKAFAALRDKLGANDTAWQAAGAAVETLDFQQALAKLDARYARDFRLRRDHSA